MINNADIMQGLTSALSMDLNNISPDAHKPFILNGHKFMFSNGTFADWNDVLKTLAKIAADPTSGFEGCVDTLQCRVLNQLMYYDNDAKAYLPCPDEKTLMTLIGNPAHIILLYKAFIEFVLFFAQSLRPLQRVTS